MNVESMHDRGHETDLAAVRHRLVRSEAMRRAERQQALRGAGGHRPAVVHQRRPSQAGPKQRPIARRTGRRVVPTGHIRSQVEARPPSEAGRKAGERPAARLVAAHGCFQLLLRRKLDRRNAVRRGDRSNLAVRIFLRRVQPIFIRRNVT